MRKVRQESSPAPGKVLKGALILRRRNGQVSRKREDAIHQPFLSEPICWWPMILRWGQDVSAPCDPEVEP